jgi:hypothetical protein
VNTLSDELEWLNYLDARYTMFEKHQQARQRPDNNQPNTTQSIVVNKNTIREREKTKNLQEMKIDRIIIQETPEEQKSPKTTNYKTNGDWKRNVKENTFKVGKLDVTKIEQRSKQFQLMAWEIYKENEVSLLHHYSVHCIHTA